MGNNNHAVSHAWAHQTQASMHGSHYYFEGDTIYSYGSHFPIARHYKGAVLFTDKGYSMTTAHHIGMSRYAVNHLPCFTVADVMANPSRKDVQNYAANIKAAELRLARSHHPQTEKLESLIKEANDFCERFGFKTRFALPDNWEAIREKAKAAVQRERIARQRREAAMEREAQEKIASWLTGAPVSLPWGLSKIYLRAVNGDMETSKGAKVPMDEAHKAYRFAMIQKAKGWHRNGDNFQVGTYQLDAVNEFGVIAGCHRIAWEEIERFAALQGWDK